MSKQLGNLCEQIFRLKREVVHVAVLDKNNSLLEFKSRDGLSTVSTQTMREFVSISPIIILGSAERLRDECGDVQQAVIRFKQGLLILYPLKQNFVVVLLDSNSDLAAVDEIGKELERIG